MKVSYCLNHVVLKVSILRYHLKGIKIFGNVDLQFTFRVFKTNQTRSEIVSRRTQGTQEEVQKSKTKSLCIYTPNLLLQNRTEPHMDPIRLMIIKTWKDSVPGLSYQMDP